MNTAVFRTYFDSLIPKTKLRWSIAVGLILLYYIRVTITGTHFLVTYCLSLYLLHGLINFLTPYDKEVPDLFDDIEVEYELPISHDSEYKPFMRKLPEYQFWMFCLQFSSIAILLTFFEIFDIPVFVPILVFYLIFIVFLTIRNLRRHMKKYKYNPFFTSKVSFK